MAASKISDYLRPEDTPLFLPVAYKDNSSLVDNFDIRYLNEGKRYVFKGYLAKPPSCIFKQKQPMTTFSITDGYLLLQFTLFGDVRPLVERLSLTPQEPIYVAGELANGPFINGAEVVDIEQIGTVKPVYTGIPGKVKPERMAAHIEKHLLAFLPNAAQTIRTQLKNVFRSNAEIRQFLNVHSMTLEELLHCVHFPTSLADAEYALSVLKRIGEVAAASDLIELSRRASVPKAVQPIYGDDIGTLTANLPFSLTDEQYGIISRTIETIKQGILLEGRLVRTGGEGYFSMVVGRQLNPQTQRRLLTLTKSNDGHFIAREDLKLRGVGDLIQGTTQHGKYHGLLRNVDIDVEILERLVQQFAV